MTKKEGAQKTAIAEDSVVAIEPDIEVRPLGRTYFRFKDFGTCMIIPDAWMNQVAIRKRKQPDGMCLAEYIATFTGKDNSEKEFLGSIYIFSKAQWEALPAEWKGIYVKIATVEDNLYFYKSNQSNPYNEQSELGQEYQSHFISMPEAPEIFVIEKR